MSYAAFINLLASAKLPAHSADGGTAIAGGLGKGRLAALLPLAAGTEFLLVAGAAYGRADDDR
jgi:hypothetical protein